MILIYFPKYNKKKNIKIKCMKKKYLYYLR